MARLTVSDIISRAKNNCDTLLLTAENEKIANDKKTPKDYCSALAQELGKFASILRNSETDPCRVSLGDVKAFAEKVGCYHG